MEDTEKMQQALEKDEQLLYLCYSYLKDRNLIDDFKDYIGAAEETSEEPAPPVTE